MNNNWGHVKVRVLLIFVFYFLFVACDSSDSTNDSGKDSVDVPDSSTDNDMDDLLVDVDKNFSPCADIDKESLKIKFTDNVLTFTLNAGQWNRITCGYLVVGEVFYKNSSVALIDYSDPHINEDFPEGTQGCDVVNCEKGYNQPFEINLAGNYEEIDVRFYNLKCISDSCNYDTTQYLSITVPRE